MRRREVLKGGLASMVAGGLLPRRATAFITAEGARPSVEWGTMAGDVTADRALIWSRTDRPSRMVVEWATNDGFRDASRVVGPAALEDSDFTARLDLTGLPAGQQVFYKVFFQDLRDLRTWSEPAVGRVRTPAAGPRDLTFVWGGDVVGQGWGINPEWGGLKAFETMRREEPDFFVHSGDTIYADNPLQAEVRLDDGSLWKNLVTEAKSKVAETLDEFRGNFRYNLLDPSYRRFCAEVPWLAQWDDHEVRNNWWPEQILDDPRYREKSAALLSARSKRAFLEYMPIRATPGDDERVYRRVSYGPTLEVFLLDMRSYRGPNSENREPADVPAGRRAILGPAQLAWLKEALRSSRATWKVIANDQPLGLVVPDGPGRYEAVANGDPGPPLGRELEIAELLGFLKKERVRNVVWLTADVHYSAAHHYDPARARFTGFDPFWEFVAGPLHAGTFLPVRLDPTFGPEVRFQSIPEGMKPNRPPSEGRQYYGRVRIPAQSRVMTVSLHELGGGKVFGVDLEPLA
jgi:alkaline phosphatase D